MTSSVISSMTRTLKVIGSSLALAALIACGDKGSTNPSASSSVAGSLIFPGEVGGNPPNPPAPPSVGTISGTVTAPQGGSIAGTAVLACVGTTAQNANCSDPASQSGQITATGSSGGYSFSKLTGVSYILIAGKDVNNNQKIDAGDYLGCYGNAQTCLAVSPPKSGANIQMSVQVAGQSATRLEGELLPLVQSAVTKSAAPEINAALTNPLQQSGRPEFVPGEVIVKFRGGVRTQSLSTLQVQLANQTVNLARVSALGAALPSTELFKAKLDAAGTLELIRQLQTRGDVEYAEPNSIFYARKVPNDPAYGVQWHYKAMNLEAAWDITDGTTGTPVTVAVVDTGSTDHPDLQGSFVGGYDFISDPVRADDGDGRDDDPTDLGGDSGYHGSHVAGTIGARSNNGLGVAGVNWGARVVPVRVLGTDGSGTSADILAGVQWAAGISVAGVPENPNPAKVVNLSLGGSRSCSQSEQQIYDSLKAKGVIVVVAAGNENDDASNSSPASCKNVITVGATGPTGTRAPYSNYGSRIDIMAPGGDTKQTITVGGKTYPAGVLSTLLDDKGQPSYVFYQGTSMATPHVAGLVSLMLSRDPGLTFETVLARLKAASAPLSATTCNRPSGTDCGAGLVDAVKALNAIGGNPNPIPAPPPPPTGNLKTYVAALKCSQPNDCTLFEARGSVITELQANRSEVSFQLTGLGSGTYIGAGWQDVNGNEKVDAGEPFGAKGPFNISDNQNLGGLVIRMKPAVVNSNTATLSATRSIAARTGVALEDTFAQLLRR